MSGFTILEVMIAVTVLTIGIFGSVGLISYTISQASNLENKVISTNLAQEGLEITRNIRDTNWIVGRHFNDWDQDNNNEAKDLSGFLRSNTGWGSSYSNIQYALAYDSINQAIYIGGRGGKFGRYEINSDTFIDLTPKISSFWGSNPNSDIFTRCNVG